MYACAYVCVCLCSYPLFPVCLIFLFFSFRFWGISGFLSSPSLRWLLDVCICFLFLFPSFPPFLPLSLPRPAFLLSLLLRSHLRSLHVALLRRYRELLALQEKREDEKTLEYFASRLGDGIIIEDEKDLSNPDNPSSTLHRTSWWRMSSTELKKRVLDVKEDLRKLRQQVCAVATHPEGEKD